MADLISLKPCTRCGTRNPAIANFCKSCALPFGAAAPQPPYGYPPQPQQPPYGYPPGSYIGPPARKAFPVLAVVLGITIPAFLLCGGGLVFAFLGAEKSDFETVKTSVDSNAVAVIGVKYGDSPDDVAAILGQPSATNEGELCTDDPNGQDKSCVGRSYVIVEDGRISDRFAGVFRGTRLIGGIELFTKQVNDHLSYTAALSLRGRPGGVYDAMGNGYYARDRKGHQTGKWDEFGRLLVGDHNTLTEKTSRSVVP